MDIGTIRAALQPYMDLFGALLLSGVATTVATEIMKLNFIPIPAQRYPRAVAAIVAVIATLIAVITTNADLVLEGPLGWLAMAVGTLLLSSVTYNNLVKGASILPTQVEAGNVVSSKRNSKSKG